MAVLFHNILEQLAYSPSEPILFTSGLFLFLFLGFTAAYCCLELRTTLRLVFVTLFSYYFYYKSSGTYFGLLALITISDFLVAKGMAACLRRFPGHRWMARLLLTWSILMAVCLLGYFKYANFLAGTLCALAGHEFRPWDIFLPAGISFYTFQSLSYTIDVYRGRIKPLGSLLDYAFYVSFFPQLVAGPIVRAIDFIPQIRKPVCITSEMFGRGVFLIGTGLLKKVVISDYISVNFVDRVFDSPTLYSGLENLLAVYGYSLQIYCDFSGYSDMAIGLALLLGFHFPDNFQSPFLSLNISDFWKRWHMSLSSWIRDYVYIPLGGNRKGRRRTYLNLILTMLLCGLWHGASMNFVAWGGMHGLAVAAHKWWRQSVMHRERGWLPSGLHRVGCVLLTFHFVAFAFIFFRQNSFADSLMMVKRIGHDFHPELAAQVFGGYRNVLLVMLLGYVSHLIPRRWEGNIIKALHLHRVGMAVAFITVAIYIAIQMRSSSIQPFIYFQF